MDSLGVDYSCRCTKSFTWIPLLDKPKNNSLIVDDIYDTGYTLEKIKHIKGSEAHVWISKNLHGGIPINTSKMMNGLFFLGKI